MSCGTSTPTYRLRHRDLDRLIGGRSVVDSNAAFRTKHAYVGNDRDVVEASIFRVEVERRMPVVREVLFEGTGCAIALLPNIALYGRVEGVAANDLD